MALLFLIRFQWRRQCDTQDEFKKVLRKPLYHADSVAKLRFVLRDHTRI